MSARKVSNYRTIVQEELLKRRSLLRGLGAGALLLYPMVRQSRVLAQQGSVPLRVLFVMNYHGWLESSLIPDGDLAQQSLTGALTPLHDLRENILFIKGLCGNGGWGNAHDDNVSAVLTGALRPNSPSFANAEGESIDQFVARRLSEQGHSFVVEPQLIAVGEQSYASHYSWKKIGTGVQKQTPSLNTENFFDVVQGRATSTSQSPPPTSPQAQARLRRKSVLDLARADIAALRGRLSAEERSHLDSQLAAIEGLEKQLGLGEPGAVANVGSCQTLTPPAAQVAYLMNYQRALRSYAGMASCGMAQFLGVLSLGEMPIRQNGEQVWTWQHGGQTRTQLPPPGPGESRTDQHDVVAHHSNAEQRSAYLGMTQTLYEPIADLASQLKQTQDIDGGSVLDNTLIVLSGTISEGNHEIHSKVLTLIGGKNAGLDLGKTLPFPTQVQSTYVQRFQGQEHIVSAYGAQVGTRYESDFYVSLARLMGVEGVNSFGDEGVNTAALEITKKA